MEIKLGTDWLMHVTLPWLNLMHVVLTYLTWVISRGMLELVIQTLSVTWLDITRLWDFVVPNFSSDPPCLAAGLLSAT